MKKHLSLLILFIFILSACSIPSNNSLGKTDALMLEAKSSNSGLVNKDEDYLKSTSYKLDYKGKLFYHEKYNISGIKNKKEITISNEKLEKIYDILNNKVKNDPKIDADDGTKWLMNFYDENSKLLFNFKGYIYNTKKEEIIKLLDSYINKS